MVKNLSAMQVDPGLIPGLRRSLGEGNGSPLQDSCLENPMDRGAWQATVQGVARNRTGLGDIAREHPWCCPRQQSYRVRKTQ